MHASHIWIPRPTSVATAILTLVAVLAVTSVGTVQNQERGTGSVAAALDRPAVDKMLASYPPGPRLAGQEMIAKYGVPQEATADRMLWHNAGPFARITLTRAELPHDFPITHMDYLEHTIYYKVPTDKADEVLAMDGSITIYPVGGELSARCDLESNNVLTLNLVHDIVASNKSVERARQEFGQAVVDRTLGKAPPSAMALQFKPASMGTAAALDTVTIPGSPRRAGANNTATTRGAVGTSGTAPGTAGGDAEIIALLIALDENEVHAAMAAQMEKVDGPILAYARMLHQAHGKHVQDTQQLAVKAGITPIETAATDGLHAKGAEQLAKLVPLDGAEFGRAFVAAMASGHREALQMIDRFMTTARNDALKQHLTATRQAIEMHLKEAEKLQKG